MPGKNPLPTVDAYLGVKAPTPPNVKVYSRAPTTADYKGFSVGDLWVDKVGLASYQLDGITAGVATWVPLGGGALALQTLTGDTGGALAPTAGNINILGTANQLAIAGAGSTLTASLPAAVTAPGSLTTTTTLTAGTDIASTAGNILIQGAAKQLRVEGGAVTDFVGTATLVNGTVTVANTNIAAADQVYVTREGINGSTALGVFNTAITAATSFTITALNPTNGAAQTNDVSTVKYFIVRQL